MLYKNKERVEKEGLYVKTTMEEREEENTQHIPDSKARDQH